MHTAISRSACVLLIALGLSGPAATPAASLSVSAPYSFETPAPGVTAGGYHLMLFGPEKALVAGDRLPLRLRFAKAGEIATELVVRSRERAATAPSH